MILIVQTPATSFDGAALRYQGVAFCFSRFLEAMRWRIFYPAPQSLESSRIAPERLGIAYFDDALYRQILLTLFWKSPIRVLHHNDSMDL
jgi:hypothetical protein